MSVSREQVLQVVKKHVLSTVDSLPEAQFDPAKSMKDLGANSLDMVEVVSCAMRELKIKVPRAELSKLTNVDGLIDLLHTEATKSA